jgi:hypothetical protein
MCLGFGALWQHACVKNRKRKTKTDYDTLCWPDTPKAKREKEQKTPMFRTAALAHIAPTDTRPLSSYSEDAGKSTHS